MKHFIILMLFALLSTITLAVEAPVEPKGPSVAPVEPKGPSVAEQMVTPYKAVVVKLQDAVEHLNDEARYEKWVAYNPLNNEETKFADLSDRQKRGFYLHRGEVLNAQLIEGIKRYRHTVVKLKSMRAPFSFPEDQQKTINDNFQEGAKALEELAAELHKIYLDLSNRREALVEAFIKDYKDEKVLVKELQEYQEKMKKSYRQNILLEEAR